MGNEAAQRSASKLVENTKQVGGDAMATSLEGEVFQSALRTFLGCVRSESQV